jgi:hypothetical protein
MADVAASMSIGQLLRLGFLAPAIIKTIAAGRLPPLSYDHPADAVARFFFALKSAGTSPAVR